MSEWTLTWIVLARLFLICLFVMFYVIGGRDGTTKGLRRFVGSGLFLAGTLLLSVFLGSFKWTLLIPSGILIAGLCLGYGGNGIKGFMRRLAYGIVLGFAGFSFACFLGLLGMGIFQFILAVSASLYYGVRNPILAVNEEAVIAMLSICLIPFMV